MPVAERLSDALDAVCGTEPAALADVETIVSLHRDLERLAAATTRAVAAFEAAREWEADGARSGAAWLAKRCRLAIGACRRRIHLGRALRHMPETETAWLKGHISEAHVRLLSGVLTPATQTCFRRDEAMLVGEATKLSFTQFTRALAYWAQLADPDGAEDDASAAHQARRLHLSATFGGSWVLDGLFDPISGAIVAKALGRIEDELFSADWAEANERVGEGVCFADLARTPAQRRADALVEMARRSGATPAGSRLPEPLFSVLVGYETFAGRICELAQGTVLAPGSLVAWLDEAWVERVVFDGADRIKNVGVRRRIFDGATRRAVEVRDRSCFHPYCEVPADRCQIDHVEPWATGGLTTDDNGRLACGFHNRARHRRAPPP